MKLLEYIDSVDVASVIVAETPDGLVLIDLVSKKEIAEGNAVLPAFVGRAYKKLIEAYGLRTIEYMMEELSGEEIELIRALDGIVVFKGGEKDWERMSLMEQVDLLPQVREELKRNYKR